MFESESIRQQSLHVLKQQSNRLKLQNKQLQLREQQIRFLKQTILALEQQKDDLLHQNHQLKQNLKTMASQINDYNTNVIQKIYQENQDITQAYSQLNEQMSRTINQKQELITKLSEIQLKFSIQNKEKSEILVVKDELNENKSKNEKKITILQKENKQLHIKNINLQKKVEENNNQINYCSQQIDLLTQKHHQSLKISQKKLKQAIQKMINKEQYDRLQRQLQESHKNTKNIKAQYEKLKRQNEKQRFQFICLKDKLSSIQIKQQTRNQLLILDLHNLKQSIKINKKVTQFQSQKSDLFDQVYNHFKQINLSKQALQKQKSNLTFQNKKIASERHCEQQQKKLLIIQYQTLRDTKQQQRQSIESSYESKILQISLRLKKQEIALSSIKRRQQQLQKLKQDLQEQADSFKAERQVLQNTINQLKKQNSQISQELTTAIKLCQENIVNKQCVGYYKYTIQNLISVIFYLHLLLLRHRQKRFKLYMPFIQYYFFTHQIIESRKKRKINPLRKFKACVYMVIACFRIKKETSHEKGLIKYVKDALQKRAKIENLSQHVQNVSKIVLNGGKLTEIIKASQNIYRWRVNNFLRVQIPFVQKIQ